MNTFEIQQLNLEIKAIEDFDSSDLGCGDQDHLQDTLNGLKEEREVLLIGAELSNRYHRATIDNGVWIFQLCFDGKWNPVEDWILNVIKNKIKDQS